MHYSCMNKTLWYRTLRWQMHQGLPSEQAFTLLESDKVLSGRCPLGVRILSLNLAHAWAIIDGALHPLALWSYYENATHSISIPNYQDQTENYFQKCIGHSSFACHSTMEIYSMMMYPNYYRQDNVQIVGAILLSKIFIYVLYWPYISCLALVRHVPVFH